MSPALAVRPLAVLAVLLPAAAHAQTDAARPLPQVEVKGAAHAYDPRRDDTAMKIVVGRQDLERYGDASVLDVLKRVPGMTVATTGRGTQVQMRGLGGGYTQVLVNGERMPAGFTLDTMAPELIERIEVMRAPTAEFSAQGIAGTINIVLRRSVRAAKGSPQNGAQRQVKLGYLGASDIRGPDASIEMAERGEKSSYSLAANAEHNSLSRPDVADTEETVGLDGAIRLLRRSAMPETGRMNRFGLTPKFNWTLDNGDTLEWQTLLTGRRFRNQVRTLVTTAVGSPPPLPDYVASMEADYNALNSSLAWTHAFASGATLEARLSAVGEQGRNLQLRSGNGVDGLPATDDSVEARMRERGLHSTGKYMLKLANGHALGAGWDGGADIRHETRAERDTLRPLAPGLVPDDAFVARLGRLALYAQDEWQIREALSAYAGVRWEGVQTRASGNGFDARTIRASIWSPVAQLLWKLPGANPADGKSDQLRLALSRTYKAPILGNLLPRRQTYENNSATEADFQGNPNLKPELAWGLDAAWEHYWARDAMVSVSTSVRRIGNYTGNRVYFDGDRWIMTPVNEDRAETRSVDLETRFPLKALLAGAPALDLRASVSRNWSRVASIPGPDNRIEQQVPLSSQLALDYKTGAFTTGASFVFKDTVRARVAVDRWAYAWARRDLEAYVVWKAGPKLQWRAALSNILGEDEGMAIAYRDAAGNLEKRRWDYPGGAKLRVTMEAGF
jgi:outer membrane receptor for ferrienterochelin and colicins